MTSSSDRMKAFVEEYGTMGIVVYFSIFFGSIGVFYALLRTGLTAPLEWLMGALHGWGYVDDPSLGSLGALGFFGAAYLLTKLIQPVRFALTFALTPIVVRVRRSTDAEVPGERSVGVHGGDGTDDEQPLNDGEA